MITKHLQAPSHEQARHLVVASYDFAKHGGAIGDIVLDTSALPDNAIITQAWIDVVTAPTSGGSATMALTVQSAGDIKAALAVASWTGIVACVPVGTAASAIKLTAERKVTMAIAVAALTAGKIKVFVEYIQSE